MKMAVFWVVAPCSLLEVYRRFSGACRLHHQVLIALMIEAASTSETSVKLYQPTRHNNPEDSQLHTGRRENLKSYVLKKVCCSVRKRSITKCECTRKQS
jgi:hypothetical protein